MGNFQRAGRTLIGANTGTDTNPQAHGSVVSLAKRQDKENRRMKETKVTKDGETNAELWIIEKARSATLS